MTARAGFVSGTALALLMAAGYAYAAPAVSQTLPPQAKDMPLVLAQAAQEEETEEERRNREEQREEAPEADEPASDEPARSQEAPTAAEPIPGQPPAGATPPPPTEAPRPPQVEQPAPTPPTQPAQPPAQQPAPPPAGGGAEPIPGQPPAGATPPPPAEQPAPTPPTQPAPPPAQQPAPPPAGGGAEPIPGQPPAGATPPPPTEAPRPPQGGQPAQPPAQQPAPPPAGGGAEPIPGQPPAGVTPPPPAEAPRPPQGGQPTPPTQPAPPAGGGAAEPVRDAPILDSDKETGDAAPGDAAQQPPAEPAAPPPASDAEAQQLEQPVQVESLREEEGRRVERREERRERREGADILREIGGRLVIQLGNNAVVQSDDRGRLERDASEVYYEELPRGRTRETVVRPNGVQVVTIRDRYGDVIRRSRIMPDGREHVLVYAGEDRERGREERRGWRDPGLDLPPLRLGISRDEYILDAGRVSDARSYYDFLEQPPVDRVRRLYSVDEVRYSARVRDSVRRIDLDTITFDFGSASIAEEAIPRLSALADAMERLLDDNPAETFLIEGHTDAVGSDLANLALSDNRAESVAAALTNVFGIPPENLVTQGYGERYLKVNTQEPERENRRVAVRRITPLVAPVASGQ